MALDSENLPYIEYDPENQTVCSLCGKLVSRTDPHLCVFHDAFRDAKIEYHEPVATLRDQFAMAALTGIIACKAPDWTADVKSNSKTAYHYAVVIRFKRWIMDGR